MTGFCFFPREEHEARLANVRNTMIERGLDLCLFASPENIYYLIGLDHQGYFGPHVLAVPLGDEMVVFARAHESTTIHRQVGNARFQGYSDTEEPGSVIAGTVKKMGLERARVAIQKSSLYLPPTIVESMRDALPAAQWSDASGIVEACRMIKSPRELGYVRRAAAISDKMINAAIEACGEGVSEKDIAADANDVMIRAGGEPPGFGPFVRSGERLPYEHELWSDRCLRRRDQVILEMSACRGRYHAPMGRLLYVGEAPNRTAEVEDICLEAQQNMVEFIRPGVTGADVYRAWQDVVDRAGLSHYRRHHCGYHVGIAFPPSWTGGIGVVGLHPENDAALQSGMVFHLMSWLLGCGRGDYFVSDTVMVSETGCEVLTTSPRTLRIV